MSRIVIQYPPDFDGELHIEAEYVSSLSPFMAPHWEFRFKHVETGGADAWSTLVAAAEAIIQQDIRTRSRKQRGVKL